VLLLVPMLCPPNLSPKELYQKRKRSAPKFMSPLNMRCLVPMRRLA
jgi:hypothetical protein